MMAKIRSALVDLDHLEKVYLEPCRPAGPPLSPQMRPASTRSPGGGHDLTLEAARALGPAKSLGDPAYCTVHARPASDGRRSSTSPSDPRTRPAVPAQSRASNAACTRSCDRRRRVRPRQRRERFAGACLAPSGCRSALVPRRAARGCRRPCGGLVQARRARRRRPAASSNAPPSRVPTHASTKSAPRADNDTWSFAQAHIRRESTIDSSDCSHAAGPRSVSQPSGRWSLHDEVVG